jgi:hypothetical protein
MFKKSLLIAVCLIMATLTQITAQEDYYGEPETTRVCITESHWGVRLVGILIVPYRYYTTRCWDVIN